MRDGDDQCATEIESVAEGLPLPVPERLRKPKRKWDPDMKLSWEEKAVLVLGICREHLAESNPEGRSIIPPSFFDPGKERKARSVSASQDRGTCGSDSVDDAYCEISLFRKNFIDGLYISELGKPRENDQEMPDEEKVEVLHIARCNEFTEDDPKYGGPICSRFSSFNLAFFDLDEESNVGLGPPLNEMKPYEWRILESSVNVISLKILESDLGYPISVYGTVLARDEVDYKCVYLYKRDREEPQLISSQKDGLMLTGPKRGLAVSGVMYFEINLNVRCNDGTGDRILSKGVIEHNVARYTKRTISQVMTSWLSTLELVCTHVPYALEATLMVTIVKGQPDFCGRITAWTTGNEYDHIILFDSEASGKAATGDGCIVSRVLSVTLDKKLTLCFSVGGKRTCYTLEHDSKMVFCNIDSYELLVEVNWTGNLPSRRKKTLRRLGGTACLL
ncbi:hypothetical protein EJB05_35001 [Eragrostis curvula]|uniref:DUF6598 domain-containing protein n=1 Tax=Eragrostis curvula TaxID=38414 RepID=A0A5J9U5H4_9POAL|nr:hypothetical protein EJB05_35001 [Eragrostis curvula]